MPKAKAVTPDWVLRLDEAVTRVSRAARSPRLHLLMGEKAKVDLGEHLHLTLAILGAGQPLRVSDLAAQLDVERSTVSRRVTELVRLGLVTRSTDQNDRRAAVLKLTRSGERALARIQARLARDPLVHHRLVAGQAAHRDHRPSLPAGR